MILAFIFALRIDQCQAPLNTPPPIPGGRLLHAQIIFRHGARTPGKNFSDISQTGPWYCDDSRAISPRYQAAPVIHPRNYHEKFDQKMMPYPPSCREQDLLLLGMQQHLDLGQMYRKYFVDDGTTNSKLLSKNFSPWEVFARSTDVDRAIRSTISFLQGLYPPASPNEIIQIMTDADDAELLDASKVSCAELSNQTEYFVNTPLFKEYFKSFSEKYKSQLEPIIGSWDPSKVKKFTSYVLMVKCTNHTLPSTFSDALIDDCCNFMAFWHFNFHNNDKYRGVASAPIYREIIRMADEFISMKSSKKLIVIGSHDTELSSMLVTLGYIDKESAPAVRSHFLFELWDVDRKIMARISFNGNPIPVSFLRNQTIYPYSQFKSEIFRSGLLNHCFIPEWQKY
ncbi:hypothetical protein M9Y10_029256 [Tritrichomonas musculus]|uniref:Histidine acid phosphatase family protein n=1 Tax=Tritrichomonas musculus TaxID=1915356 RepID=A0ABR2KLM1_9EUKA